MIRNRTAHASTGSITLMVARTQANETAYNLFGFETNEISEIEMQHLTGMSKSYATNQHDE